MSDLFQYIDLKYIITTVGCYALCGLYKLIFNNAVPLDCLRNENRAITYLRRNTSIILVIPIEGKIGEGTLEYHNFEQTITDIFDKYSTRIKCILLLIESGGGSVYDSEMILNTLFFIKNKYQIPLYAQIESLCASGALMISCCADRVFASPASIIGSIGVRSGTSFNFKELISKIGIHAKTITKGRGKDELDGFRDWNDNEGEITDQLLDDAYDRFLDIVSKSRDIDRHVLKNQYGAGVFYAKRAQEIGLIDEPNSDYYTTLGYITKKLNLEKYTVVKPKYESKKSFWNNIFTSSTGVNKFSLEYYN